MHSASLARAQQINGREGAGSDFLNISKTPVYEVIGIVSKFPGFEHLFQIFSVFSAPNVFQKSFIKISN